MNTDSQTRKRGKRVTIEDEPAYARLSKREGHGRTRRTSIQEKWKKPGGGIKTISSGARGSPRAGRTGGLTVEIESEIDDLWERGFKPSREYTIKLESDAVYHVDNRENRTEITRYERKDDEYLHEWSEDVPEEDRELTIEKNAIELPQNSDLNNLEQEIEDLLTDESNVETIARDLKTRYREAGLINRVGRESIDGDVVSTDRTWIRNGENLFVYDHGDSPENLWGEPAYYIALSFLNDDNTSLDKRIKTAAPLDLGALRNISEWVEVLQEGNIPDRLDDEDVLDNIRQTRNDRIESHVYGDISDFDNWKSLETENGIYEVEGVEATRVNGIPRIESVQGTKAPTIELEDIDNRFVKKYLTDK